MLRNKFLIITLFFIYGCNLAPEFAIPETSKAPQFKEAQQVEGKWKEVVLPQNPSNGQWWQIFANPELDALINELHKNNNDLAAAAAIAKQYAALADFEGAKQLPLATGNANVNRQKTSDNSVNGSFQTKPYNSYKLGMAVSYELDLFGKVSNGVEAVIKDYESADAAYKNIMLILESNLAQNYFGLLATRQQAELIKQSINHYEEQNKIISKRLELGAASELDMNLANSQLASAKLQALELDKQVANLEHSLAVLVGKAPADANLLTSKFQFISADIPAGLPSDLLLRRPDIVAAIKALQAQNARVGIARASYFPDITLTAGFGYESMDLADLFKWSSHTWFLGPIGGSLIDFVVYDGGRYFARVEGAKAKYEEVTANYKQAALKAFQEVEDNLSDIKYIKQQLEQAEKASAALAEAEKMMQIKYDNGAVSYFDLKEIQQQAISSGQQKIEMQKQLMLKQIALIKSIGGSWKI